MSALSENDKLRLAEMVEHLDEPDHILADSDTKHPVHVFAFARDFAEEEDESDDGFVLVTSGMSDKAMPLPPNDTGDESPRAELIWYVRDLNDEYTRMLRWLAKLPSFDGFFLGSGHRVPMPEPILSFSYKTVFMTLDPIITRDSELLSSIELGGHAIRTLNVHLLTAAEYALVKSEDGLNTFLDLMDEKDYPHIFDPKRLSYVE